jgi:hypothetical protein
LPGLSKAALLSLVSPEFWGWFLAWHCGQNMQQKRFRYGLQFVRRTERGDPEPQVKPHAFGRHIDIGGVADVGGNVDPSRNQQIDNRDIKDRVP